MKLSIGIITSRHRPEIKWLVESILNEWKDVVEIIVVDLFALELNRADSIYPTRPDCVRWVEPKPNIWQGRHRLTHENWWSAGGPRNTFICLANGEWLMFLDDRGVLLPGWTAALKEAMDGNYVMAGAYEKRHGMSVENGVIVHGGIVDSNDSREKWITSNKKQVPYQAGGEWLFGCCFALPLEWMLEINGVPEDYCDSLSFEDVQTGLILENCGKAIKYDTRCKLVEDRTPGKCEPVMKRTDKGVSPNDKSHAILREFKHSKTSKNSFDIRQMRADVQSGKPFPNPTQKPFDWYDGQPVQEFR